MVMMLMIIIIKMILQKTNMLIIIIIKMILQKTNRVPYLVTQSTEAFKPQC